MDSENKIRLVLETQGADKVQAAAKSIEDLADELNHLNDELEDINSGAIEKTIRVIEELDDSIANGAIKSTGEFWISLKDGQRLLANTGDGFRKLIDDEGRFLVTLADGRRVWSDSKAAVDAMNEALARYQKEMNRAATESHETMESLEDFMASMRGALKHGLEEPTEQVMHFVSRLGKTPEEVKKANDSIKKMAGESGRQSDTGRKMMELSYMLDDIQYGFHGIANNIPRFAQSFGIGASAVGAIGIAAVGVNQALKYLGPLLESTEKPLKPLKERLEEFAKGLGASKVEAEKLTTEIQKMADRVPDMFRSFDGTLSKINEILRAQKELDAMKKEDEKRAADAAAERARIEARQNKNDDKGKVYKEFTEGLTPDQDIGVTEKLAADQMEKARNDVIDAQVNAMEAAGTFNGRMVPKETLRLLAKEAIRKKTPQSNDEIKAAAQRRADEIRNKAMQGDQTALTTLEAISPEFAQFSKETADDEQFQAALEKRSAAGAARRKAEEDARKANAAAAKAIGAAQKPLIGKIGDQQMIDGAQVINNDLEEQAREAAQELVKDQIGKLQKQNAENAQKQSAAADIQNQVLEEFDPYRAAVARQQMAGQDPARFRRNMQLLQKRDEETFAAKLMQRGMGTADAAEAARQSIAGGQRQFLQMAESEGASLKSVRSLNEAAARAMMRMQMQNAEMRNELNTIQRQFEMIGNQGQPAKKPQLPRMRP